MEIGGGGWRQCAAAVAPAQLRWRGGRVLLCCCAVVLLTPPRIKQRWQPTRASRIPPGDRVTRGITYRDMTGRVNLPGKLAISNNLYL